MRMWALALHTNEDLTITYRLGPKEEASVTAVLQDEGHEVCSLLGSVRTSGMPIWPEGAGANAETAPAVYTEVLESQGSTTKI